MRGKKKKSFGVIISIILVLILISAFAGKKYVESGEVRAPGDYDNDNIIYTGDVDFDPSVEPENGSVLLEGGVPIYDLTGEFTEAEQSEIINTYINDDEADITADVFIYGISDDDMSQIHIELEDETGEIIESSTTGSGDDTLVDSEAMDVIEEMYIEEATKRLTIAPVEFKLNFNVLIDQCAFPNVYDVESGVEYGFSKTWVPLSDDWLVPTGESTTEYIDDPSMPYGFRIETEFIRDERTLETEKVSNQAKYNVWSIRRITIVVELSDGTVLSDIRYLPRTDFDTFEHSFFDLNKQISFWTVGNVEISDIFIEIERERTMQKYEGTTFEGSLIETFTREYGDEGNFYTEIDTYKVSMGEGERFLVSYNDILNGYEVNIEYHEKLAGKLGHAQIWGTGEEKQPFRKDQEVSEDRDWKQNPVESYSSFTIPTFSGIGAGFGDYMNILTFKSAEMIGSILIIICLFGVVMVGVKRKKRK